MNFFIQRLLSAALLLFIVSFASFGVLMIIPGDPIRLMLGTEASPDLVEELGRQYGFHLPWYERYWNWLIHALQGDLGQSFLYKLPVTALIIDRIPVSASLTALSMLITLIVALPLGIIAAIRKGSLLDKIIQALVQFAIAIPNFWIGILLLIAFSVLLPWFPPGSYKPLSEGLLPHMQSLFLPAVTLAIGEAAVLIRMIRASYIEVLNKDFMVFAHTNGLPKRKTYLQYGLRNSLIGPITMLGLQTMSLISGVIIIEQLFTLPGIGRLLLVAVQQRDLILMQGLVLFITFTVIIINLLVDLLYSIVDPRISFQQRKKVTA
ncbi:ABC transporter permease [Paenibacillus sp. IITD108]|uniref:ABC transporter permease n=1 Tax=Paenibacillus sp. IITD108 TaxID=3116649 RepID=UPI002F42D5A3